MPRLLGKRKGSLEVEREIPRVAGQIPIKIDREIYAVLADNLNQTGDDILATQGIPAEGATRGNQTLRRRIAREEKTNAGLWEVELEWDSRTEGGQDEGDDPTTWRPEVRWTAETIDLPMPFDQVTGAPIENSVEEPFLDVTMPQSVPVRLYTRYEANDVLDYYDDLQLAYMNRINSKEFRGWPPWTVLMASIEADEAVIHNRRYARVTYITKYLDLIAPKNPYPVRSFDPDDPTPNSDFEVVGWKLSLLNQGTKYFVYDNPSDWTTVSDVVEFRDRDGFKTTGNLYQDGRPVPPGSRPVWLRWFRHQLADLNELRI